jgi:hypothetical protein
VAGKVCIHRVRMGDHLYCRIKGGKDDPPRPIAKNSPCDRWHRGDWNALSYERSGTKCFVAYNDITLDMILFEKGDLNGR